MDSTVSIAKAQVKQLIIYQTLKLRFNNGMNLYQRRQQNLLNFIAEKADGSRVAFCNTYDMTESRLAQLLSDTYRDGKAFGERAARSLEEKLGLEALYFERDITSPGDYSIYKPVHTSNAAENPSPYQKVIGPDPGSPGIVFIRKIKLKLSAGITGFSSDPDHDEGDPIPLSKRWLTENGFNEWNLVAIKVRGDSMEPTLRAGDTVIINTADKKPHDGSVFAVNYEGEDVVKRMSRDIGQWWLCSDNPDQQRYHRKVCQGDACIMIGRIVRRISDYV